MNRRLRLVHFATLNNIGQYRGSTFCSKLIDVFNLKLTLHIIAGIPALGKPLHRVALAVDGQRLFVVLSFFFAKFCRQLGMRSSGKLLNPADLI